MDFIVGELECAIECKASINNDNKRLKGLRELKKEHDRVKRRLVVCFEERPRITEDNIEIIHANDFVKKLWAGEIII